MKLSIKNLLPNLYIIISLLLLLFVNFDGATSFLPMVVPHIEGHVVVIHLMFAMVLVIVFFLSKVLTTHSIKKDPILLGLILKAILDYIPVLRGEADLSVYFWYYAITLVSLISYFILSNSDFNLEETGLIRNFFIIFGVVISAQVFYTAANAQYSWIDIYFKSAMVIPYGGSNIIAAILVPIICLVYLTVSGNKKWWIIILLTIAVILTKSRGGILLEMMVGSYLIFQKMGERNNRHLRRLFLIVTILVFAIAILQNNEAQTFLNGYTSVSANSGINALLSGRITVWKEAIEEIHSSGHLLFGIGMQTKTGYITGAHNIVIDVLLKCGIIGFINYLIMVIIFIRRGITTFKRKTSAWYFMGVVILLNSLFEVCYFAYSCDLMLWMIIGLSMSDYYRNRMVTNG